MSTLGGIAYADKHNFIPVVDMKNYKNSYLYDDEVGKINAWEYYFEQPSNISVEEAISNKIYISGPDATIHDIFPEYYISQLYYNRDGMLDYWRGLCKKYIRFKPEVLNRLEDFQKNFSGKKILGVSIRGTDYVSIKPKGHPVQPTPEQAIAKAQEILREKNFDAIYLATEDKIIVEKFQKAFGENLILPECDYPDFDYNGDKWVTLYFSERKNDKYLRGLEYLISKLLLTKCNGLITSMNSGAVGTMCLSEGFDYLYVFDLGQYE